MIKEKPHFKKIIFLSSLTLLFLMSAVPMYFGPGLAEAEPIAPYLNGTFPTVVEDPYEVAFPGITFNSPLNFNIVPGANERIVVGQRNGQVFWFNNAEDVTVKTEVVDLSDKVGVVWDGGFLGLAIHPNFGTAGSNYFFTYYTTKDANGNDFPNIPGGDFNCTGNGFDEGNYLILEKFEVNPVTLKADANTSVVMMKMKMYGRTHRGGGLIFGDDGFLYITTGDQTTNTKSQDIVNNLDGGVLRVDVDMNATTSHLPRRFLQTLDPLEISGEGYYIPNDNPFNNVAGNNFEEYYTRGHRNPHRLTKDSETGILYIGEVGGTLHEEINVINPEEDAGGNYGWPLYEGLAMNQTCMTVLPDDDVHKEPLVAFPRNEANAIIGGYVYRGTEMTSLIGKYICADWGVGEDIWAVDTVNGQYELIGNFLPENIISFGENYDKELYMLKEGEDINLYKLKSAIPAGVPSLLSETGAFSDLTNLVPEQGLIPYELIESFWSDGALKKRWMAVPNDGAHDTEEEQVKYSEEGIWNFPKGTVLVKHFDFPIDENNPYETKKIETRFSIKAENDKFYFLTYRWNEDETDAVLQDTGANRDIDVTTLGGGTETVTWRYPSNSECISCHNASSGGSLGPRARYLNKDYLYPNGGVGNQLVTLSHLGILDQPITDADTPDINKHKALNDESASIEDIARSYLDLNCAYCHRPGTGIQADFDLRVFKSLAQTGLLNAGINNPIPGLGADQKIVYAGDASKSQLWHRPSVLQQSEMMPPLAKDVVDDAGVAMIKSWIDQMSTVVLIPPGTYEIINKNSDLSMEVENGGNNKGDDIIQGTNEGEEHQRFQLDHYGDDVYDITTLYEVIANEYGDLRGGSIDISGGAAAAVSGTNIQLWEDNSTEAQRWKLIPAGDGYFYIKSNVKDLFLGIENEDTTEGASIKVLTGNGTDNIKWRFNDVNATNVVAFETITETVNENEETLSFNVAFTGNVPGGFSVDYTTTNGTAEAPGDYEATTGTLVIDGEDTYRIDIPILEDTLIEDTENFTIQLSNPSVTNVTITPDQATGTINDNDAYISFSEPIVSVDEGVGTAVFNVTLTGNVSEAFSVDYTVAMGTATANDYNTVSISPLNFTGVANQTIPISIAITDDADIEPIENFTINLTDITTSLATITTPQAVVSIVDNDAVEGTGLALNTEEVTINEDAGTIVFSLTLTGNVPDGFTVDYTTADGSALLPGDYDKEENTITFLGEDQESYDITINITDDSLIEEVEDFYLNLSNLSTNLIPINTPQAKINITDNDVSPGVGISFENNIITVNEEDGTATFRVKLIGAVQGGFSLDYATENGLASSDEDYEALAITTLNFNGDDGETLDIVVPITDDNLIEESENFFLNLSNISTNLITIITPQATGNILDNDAIEGTGISFATTNVIVDEASGQATFSVVLTGNVPGGFTLDYAAADGTAQGPLDYVPKSGTLEFVGQDGESKNITVIILEDDFIEIDEYLVMNLTNLSTDLITINASQAISTITDNDAIAGTGISFDTTDIIVDEATGIASLTVRLTGKVPAGFSIDYTTANGNAIAPGDFILTNGTLNFNGDDQELYTIEVPVIDDSLIESLEFFEINLYNLSTTLITVNTTKATVTITDNDTLPGSGLSFENTNVTVDEAAGTLFFTVRLTGDVPGGFTVDYNTIDDTAIAALDYTMLSGTLNFDGDDGEFYEIAVPIIEDVEIEEVESFKMLLSNISRNNIPINTTEAVGNIADNDVVDGTGISLDQTSLSFDENSGIASFLVTLTGNLPGGFTIDYATSDISAEAPNDYIAQNGTLNFDGTDGETKELFISLIDDTFIESDEEFAISLSNISNTLIPINNPNNTATILDDDLGEDAGISFVNTALSINENAGTAVFTVVLNGNYPEGFTIDYKTLDVSAVDTEDYIAQNGTLIFNGTDGETKEVIVNITDDTDIEDTEEFRILLSNVSNAIVRINTPNATASILDNDVQADSGLSFLSTNVSVNEDAGTATFSVLLTGNYPESFTVDYATTDGTAVSTSDYTVANGTLSFNGIDGETKDIVITITDDTVIEDVEDFLITLSNVSIGNLTINTPNATGSILDDDVADSGSLDFVITPVIVNEQDGMAIFTVQLTGDYPGGFTVDYATSDITAVSPKDYIGITGTLSFDGIDGETKEILVSILDDAILENDEEFMVSLANISITNLPTSIPNATGRIIDNDFNDGATSISFVNTSLSIDEDAGIATFSVLFTGNYPNGFTVDYATADGSAISPTDYTATNGTLSFNGTDGEIKEIVVNIINDSSLEGAEDFEMVLSNISNEVVVINGRKALGTIVDDILDVNTVNDEFLFKFYPNPLTVDDVLNVFFDANEQSNPREFIIELHGIDGERIFKKSYSIERDQLEVNIELAHLASGVYLVTLRTIDTSETKQLIISH